MARLVRGTAATVVLLALVVGAPLLLIALVGNPWPGRTRIELGDELAVVVGVLAVLGWLLWLRFVVTVVVELHGQLAERRWLAADPVGAPPSVLAPPARRMGTGQFAQRFVAAVLLLLPVGTRLSPSAANALTPSVPSAAQPAGAAVASPAVPAPTPSSPVRSVTVAPGDTLIGIARAELGDAARWREIFDANRETVQPDGGRLASPSLIRVGWTLLLPAGPTPPALAAPAPAAPDRYVAAETVTVEAGDNLWRLAADRLEAAGLPPDEVATADYVHAVINDNADVVEDPNLIFVGERFVLPAIGTSQPAPLDAATVDLPAPVDAPVPELTPTADASPAATTAPSVVEPVATAPITTAGAAATTSTPTTTTTVAGAPAAPDPGPGQGQTSAPSGSPMPVGLGEAALLSAGVIALVASRRRLRLRASTPRARVPEPHPDAVDAERRLRSVDASERLLRVDVAVRAAAASLVYGTAEIAIVRAGSDGVVELTLSGAGVLPPPWEGRGDTWRLPGSTPIELLAEPARTVGAPCVALTQLGVDSDGREVLADLEALGLLAIDAPPELADAVLRGLAATLASSVFAEVAHLIVAGLDERVLLGHRHAHAVSTVDDALELAATLVGTTSAARQSTFVLRARRTSGEAWEPAIVFVAGALCADVTADVARAATRAGAGLAVVAGGSVPAAPWTLRVAGNTWWLEPLGLEIVPVGLTGAELDQLHAVVAAADEPLIESEPFEVVESPSDEGAVPVDTWQLLVRLFGTVEIADRSGTVAAFERSKAVELVAWLTMHRERATRVGARTALWELDVRDATFANVVSEARRAMGRLVEPPAGDEWLGRTLTEVLPLHDAVVADADLIRTRLDAARLQPPELAIETLRPAVELVRGAPFCGTGYLWPDAEGITSNLVLLATSAATELAGHYLSMGDIDGVFWATDRGLRVLPGHEELIALRMRAHARAGDLAGVRHEWESYERVLNADPWSDGEPAAKLVHLRRELLSS